MQPNITDHLNMRRKFPRTWSPDMLDLAAWYDASDASTIVQSGGNVSQWNDKSGNRNHIGQATGAYQPVTDLETIGGLNAIRFKGALTGDTTYLFTAISLVPALQFDSVGGYSAFGIMRHKFSGSIDSEGIYWSKVGVDPGFSFSIYEPAGLSERRLLTGYASPTNESFTGDVREIVGKEALFSIVRDDANLSGKTYLGGELVSSKAMSAPVISDDPDGYFIVGAELGIAGSDMDLGELIFVKGPVSDDERERIEGYLAHKWNVPHTLRDDHPFRLDAPEAYKTVNWTPSDIQTVAWYDAADVSTITEAGGFVSQWNDKSGNGKHATQSNGALQPLTGSQSINGLNTIYFNFDWMNTNLTQLTTASIYYVFHANIKSHPANNTPVHAINNGSGGTPSDGGCYVTLQNYGSPSTSNHSVFYTIPSAATRYLNGVLNAVDHGFNPGFASHQGTGLSTLGLTYKLGCVGIAGNSDANLDLGEVIICPSVHDVATRQRIEGYLAHKWGLTANLPGGHPYKTVAPRMIEAPCWSPSRIATVSWYDPSDESTITATGVNVDQLADKSGNSNHLISEIGWKPKTGTAKLNGMNVLDGSSGNRMRTNAPLVGRGNDFSIIGVFDPSAFCIILGQGLQANNDWLEIYTSSIVMGGGNGSFSIPNTHGGTADMISFDFDYSALQSRGYVNGTLEGSTVLVATAGNDDFRIGLNRTLSDVFIGDMAELIIINNATPYMRQLIEGYLAWKWGVVDKLPITHPYKRNPPRIY